MDWFSRYVISWRLYNSLDADFCVDALESALTHGRPEIFNTDQGSQFTSCGFTGVLKSQDVAISMDGKGRAINNVIIESLWRTVKYEEVYLKEYSSGSDCYQGLDSYLDYYDHQRRHQSLARTTPWEVNLPNRANRLLLAIQVLPAGGRINGVHFMAQTMNFLSGKRSLPPILLRLFAK